MKITGKQLRRLISEELDRVIREFTSGPDMGVDWHTPGEYTLVAPDDGELRILAKGGLAFGPGTRFNAGDQIVQFIKDSPLLISAQGAGEVLEILLPQSKEVDQYVQKGDPIMRVRVESGTT
jgi:hypothetical protein